MTNEKIQKCLVESGAGPKVYSTFTKAFANENTQIEAGKQTCCDLGLVLYINVVVDLIKQSVDVSTQVVQNYLNSVVFFSLNKLSLVLITEYLQILT